MSVVKIEFNPANEKQRQFIFSKKRYTLLSGAVGGGKSFLGCWKGFLTNVMNPGSRGLITRKEQTTLKNSTMLTLFEKVIPKEMVVSYNQQRGELVHRTIDPEHNSTIVFCGLDKKADQSYPTKIGSTEYTWVFVDEMVEIDKEDFQMLSTRIRYNIPWLSPEENDKVPKQLFGATNPEGPDHWACEFFIDNPEEKQDRDVIYITPYDNPYLPKEYIHSLEESMTGISRLRLLDGKWVRAEGVIYKDFDPNIHVDSERFLPYNEYKDLIIGADANYPIPRAAVLIGIRGDGGRDLLEEFYEAETHVEDLCEWVASQQKIAKKTITVYHDPSDPSAIDKLSQVANVIAEKADNKVLPGISEVGRHFAQNKIRINPTCKNTIRELTSYRWKKGKEKEAPDKAAGDDHAVDALRYALFSYKEGSGGITVFVDKSGFF